MNRPPTKAELRAQHAKQVEEYLARGGKINTYDMGESALVDGNYNTRHIVIEKTQPATRTPVPEVVAAIDARRRSGRRSATPKAQANRPRQRRKVIYDDFGEPLRTIWVDE